MKLDPCVKIAVCYGGYVVRARTWDPDNEEGLTRTHTCASIDEVLQRVREAIESQDRLRESDYKSIEGAKK